MFITRNNSFLESYTMIKSIQSCQELESVIEYTEKGYYIYIVTSYTTIGATKNLRSGRPVTHTPNSLTLWFRNCENNIYYVGKDNLSSVYIFKPNFNESLKRNHDE